MIPFLVLALLVQDDPAIDQAQIDGLAKRWGERWYVGHRKDKLFFAGRLKITESTHEKEPVFSLDGEARMGMDGTFYAARAALTCRKDRTLTPLKFSCDAVDDKGRTVAFLSTLADGKITTRWGASFETSREKEVPPDLVHTLAMLPLATAARFQKDATLKMTYYDIFDNYGRVEKQDCSITNAGLEEVGARKAHRIVLKWGRQTHAYWVSETRELLQFSMAGSDFGVMTLTDEKTGKAALEELKAKLK
jgi:hypothetical protein